MKTFSISIALVVSVFCHQVVAQIEIHASAFELWPAIDLKRQEAGQREKTLRILAQAVEVAETEPHPSIKAELLASLAPVYIKLGEQEKGYALLARAQRVIEEEDNPAKDCDDCPGKDFYRVMLAIDLAQSGLPSQASELLERMVRAIDSGPTEIRAQRLAKLAFVFIETGSKERALKLLSESSDLTRTITDPVHRAGTLEVIAKGYTASAQLGRAMLVATMMEKGPSKDMALIAIAKKYAELRQYDRALSINDKMRAGSFRPDILIFVAGQYLKNGEKEKGIAVLQKALASSARVTAPIQMFARDDIALLFAEAGEYQQALKISKATGNPSLKLKLAPIFARGGRTADAEELLSQAYRYTSDLTEFYQAPELVADAAAYAAIGKKEKAVALLAEAERVIEASKYSEVKGAISCDIVLGYLNIGDTENALRIANQIRDDALSGVTALLAIASKYSGTEQLLNETERFFQEFTRPDRD